MKICFSYASLSNLLVLPKNEINRYNMIYDTTTVLQQCLQEPIFLKNVSFHKIPSLKSINQMLE